MDFNFAAKNPVCVCYVSDCLPTEFAFFHSAALMIIHTNRPLLTFSPLSCCFALLGFFFVFFLWRVDKLAQCHAKVCNTPTDPLEDSVSVLTVCYVHCTWVHFTWVLKGDIHTQCKESGRNGGQ